MASEFSFETEEVFVFFFVLLFVLWQVALIVKGAFQTQPDFYKPALVQSQSPQVKPRPPLLSAELLDEDQTFVQTYSRPDAFVLERTSRDMEIFVLTVSICLCM